MFDWVRGSAVLGVVAASWFLVRSDVAKQKILNRHLRLCFLLGVCGYAALAAHSAVGAQTGAFPYLVGEYYRSVGLYLAVSLAAGFALWQLRMWPAGDAKLFFLLAFLFPLTRVPGWFDPWRVPLIAMINIFIPASLVMFGRAFLFVWRLYLDNQADFLRRLGWHNVFQYLAQGLSSGRDALQGAKAGLLAALADPLPALGNAAAWAASMLLTSAVALRLQSMLGSTLLVSGACFLVLIAWQNTLRQYGRGWSAGASVALAAVLIDWRDPAVGASALRCLTSLSVFSLSIQWGINLTKRLLQERGLVFAPALGLLTYILPMILLNLFGITGFGAMLLRWSLFGGLFGLGYMLVQILEESDCPTVHPADLRPFQVLSPAFVDRMRAVDADFCDEHLDPLYADGLTPAQADELKSWCLRNEVPLVPLHNTVSFAGWIFLGYGLTWVLGGHVLQGVL